MASADRVGRGGALGEDRLRGETLSIQARKLKAVSRKQFRGAAGRPPVVAGGRAASAGGNSNV